MPAGEYSLLTRESRGVQAPAETCDRNRKFEQQLELAGPSMASMVKQLKKTLKEHC